MQLNYSFGSSPSWYLGRRQSAGTCARPLGNSARMFYCRRPAQAERNLEMFRIGRQWRASRSLLSTTICTTYTCLCVSACVYIYIPHTHKHTRCMLVFVCTCDSAETNRETVETQILNDPLKLNKTLHFSQYILPLAFGFFKYPRTRKKQNDLFSSSI